MGDEGPARDGGAVGPGTVPRPPGVEGAASGGDLHRHALGIDTRLGGRHPQLPGVVGGPVELLDHPRATPPVRAPHVLDRPAGSGGVVEGDPAADPFGRVGPQLVARVLVKPEGPPARGLPQDVVLAQPGPGPSTQAGAGAADVGAQHGGGDGAVRLPGVADLTGQVLGVAPGSPVPLVGLQARLEAAGEQFLVPLDQGRHGARVDDALADDEAVVGEASHVLLGELQLHAQASHR